MTREVRGAMPTSIEWMIMAYVAGMKRIPLFSLDMLKVYRQSMVNFGISHKPRLSPAQYSLAVQNHGLKYQSFTSVSIDNITF